MDNGWNFATLKEHFEKLREADKQALDAAFEAAKEKSAMHNELIQSMERQQATFITKGQAYSALGTIIAVLGLLIAYYSTIGGHS